MGSSGLGFLMRLWQDVGQCCSHQGLDGDEEIFFQDGSLYSWQAGVDCWQEASVACHRDLSIELLECPHDT